MGIRSQNNPIAAYLDVFSNTGTDAAGAQPAPTSGLTATGGVISDYTSGSDVYRAHVFTSSGALNVTALSTNPSLPDTVDYLLVAGGGGTASASSNRAGGGGAGGFLTGTNVPVSVSSYAIVVGGGGAGNGPASNNGVPTTALGQTAYGGGGGGFNDHLPTSSGGNGGSGGGAWYVGPGGVGGKGVYPGSPYVNAPRQGYDGSPGFGSPEYGGGGGGAGGAGGRGNSGGAGAPNVYAYGPTNPVTYSAGGAASDYPSTNRTANGVFGTGNGASGEGSGGSGVAVIRYKIAELTSVAKATGGAISFYSGKTIHTFIGSGTFATASNWSSATVEYVIIGGGGGGGKDDGGGGGAGAVRIGTTPIGAHPVSTAIQVGAGGDQYVDGTPSYFGSPITAAGGGAGGTETPSSVAGKAGGSGGGGAGGFGAGAGGNGTGDDFPGSSPFVSPSNGWGNNGGSGGPGSGANYSGGGGGGASEVGASTPVGNYGGRGMQLSPTFRDPSQSVGAPGEVGYGAPQPGRYFAAGGGGTRTTGNGTGVGYGMGGIGGGGWGGSNSSAPNSPLSPPGSGTNGDTNTGSGGGGGDLNNDAASQGGTGGSGIVLIAYPS